MLSESDRRRVEGVNVARLATVRPDGRPHIVPITFALDADDLVTAVDHKPKRHRRLQRLANLRANPQASVLVDHWAIDWTQLWWVRLDGVASIRESDSAAVEALADRHPQYADQPPRGPVIRVRIEAVSSWSSSP